MTAKAENREFARVQNTGTARIETAQRGMVESPVKPMRKDMAIRVISLMFLDFFSLGRSNPNKTSIIGL